MTVVLNQTTSAFAFTLQAQVGQARAGVLQTPHGAIETPVFMPVGTHSTVKTLTWPQVKATGAQIVLANAYHLYLRPGPDLIAKAGGLHSWMNWQGPILTDSGGFQVFSLAALRKITPQGVHFQDAVSGNKHFIGPKESMAMQNAFGADIIMAFDECPPYPVEETVAEKSLELTQRWLEECVTAHARPLYPRDYEQALFPIVQGSCYERLRAKAVEWVTQVPAHGYAIGGVSVGEPRAEMHRVTAFTAPLLPQNKPRYLMGVGTLEDFLQAVAAGVDMADCVLPTRNARHGGFFTEDGTQNIRKACYEADFSPLVEGCECFACQNHSRAYIRHIYRQEEATAKTLLSIHNLQMLAQLAKSARASILEGTFSEFYGLTMEKLQAGKAKTEAS